MRSLTERDDEVEHLKVRTSCNAMRDLLIPLLLLLAASTHAAEPRQPCSGSAFLATNYSWLGIPVMRNASQSAGDSLRCLYVVPVSGALAEDWHRKRFTEEGWTPLARTPTERGVELEFQKADQLLQVAITELQVGTAVLLKRPILAGARAR